VILLSLSERRPMRVCASVVADASIATFFLTLYCSYRGVVNVMSWSSSRMTDMSDPESIRALYNADDVRNRMQVQYQTPCVLCW